MRILDDLANRILEGDPEEDEAAKKVRLNKAIPFFKKAIALSPFSYHYYDALVRIYKKLQLYEEIRPLLESGLKQVNIRIDETNKLTGGTGKAEAMKRLKLLQSGFQSRINGFESGKKRGEEYRAKKAEKQKAEMKK